MSIASEISRLQTAKADLKTSIESKGVTVPSSAKLDDYADYVDSIQTGGSANIQSLSVTTNGTYTASGGVDGYSPVVVNVSSSGGGGSATDPVRFIDYDGAILYSYSLEDFANLTAMPANPTHAGLTSQGWNWTLADAKAQLTAHPDGGLTIGQMYITDDGKTRVYITLADSERLSPYLGIGVNGTVVVDWGDNTATDTLTGGNVSTVQRAQHTYASTGDYVITLTATERTFALLGTANNGSYLLTRTATSATSQRSYQNAIQKVELGANVSIGNYALSYCYSLASITIPSSVISINQNAFYYCNSLASVTIPSGVTSLNPSGMMSYCFSLISVSIPSGVTNIGQSIFRGSFALAYVTIPSGVTDIKGYVFYDCHSIKNITIPSGVTSIGDDTFYACYSLASLTIPSGVTSIAASAFSNCQSLASLTIPSGVTSIAASAFYNCYSVVEYHFLPTTPPTLANTNAFSNISSDCKIYVPAASLTAYQEATNWSEYASYMVGE